MSAVHPRLALRFIVIFLTATSLVDLVIMLGIVGVHAYSHAVSVAVLTPMTFVLAGASSSAVVLALCYALLSYPRYRWTFFLLAVIMGSLLAAHLYTIDDPPLLSGGNVSGTLTLYSANPSFGDSYVTVTPPVNFSSSPLFLTVTSDNSPLASVAMKLDGAPLTLVSMDPAFSTTDPLQPGASSQVVWSLPNNFTQVKVNDLGVSYQYLNCYDTSKDVEGCVMDEVYYVPAAQTMLAGEKCAPYADNCNLEHPWLSKAFIAAGIAIFGNNAPGWRIFEVILGTFSIPILFGIAWTITKNERLSLYAAFLLAFETLFFVHSSIAVIDVGAIFFGLLGFFFYFARPRWWIFSPTLLTAGAFGLALLSKETAIMLLLVLAIYHLLFGEGSISRRYFWVLGVAAGAILFFAAGLQVYDTLFGAGAARTFYGQIEFILNYGASLKMTATSRGWIDPVLNTPITPLNWVTYYSPVGYLVTNVKVTTGTSSYTYVAVGYYGVTDQFEVWLAYLWGGYTIYLWRKTRNQPMLLADDESREYKIARLALVWVLVIFLAYLGLYLYGRVTYPYYFIQAVPALSLGSAWFLSRRWFPQEIAYVVLAGVLLWFFLFYPDKSFLPIQLRVLIGH